jgi:hypothetical protein
MFKTVTISFRTKQELLEWIDHVSRESRCSRSSLIETVLRNYFKGKTGSDIQLENRVEIKGLEPLAGGREPPEGITYVTVGEVSIGLPKNRPCRISLDETQSIFKLDFAADYENKSGVLFASGREGDHAGHSVKETDAGRLSTASMGGRK